MHTFRVTTTTVIQARHAHEALTLLQPPIEAKLEQVLIEEIAPIDNPIDNSIDTPEDNHQFRQGACAGRYTPNPYLPGSRGHYHWQQGFNIIHNDTTNNC